MHGAWRSPTTPTPAQGAPPLALNKKAHTPTKKTPSPTHPPTHTLTHSHSPTHHAPPTPTHPPLNKTQVVVQLSRNWRPAAVKGLPEVFTGGWVGYAGYDTVRYVYAGACVCARALGARQN